MDLDRYAELKRIVDDATAQVERARGALEQIRKRLYVEHGVRTIAAAKKKLAKLKELELITSREFDRALAGFERDFKEVTDA